MYGGTALAENNAALETFVVVCAFEGAALLVKLLLENGKGGSPWLVTILFPIVEKPVLEEAACVHFLDEMHDFFVVRDDNAVIVAFDLAEIELLPKGGDVRTGRIGSRCEEGCFHCNLFAVRDDEP